MRVVLEEGWRPAMATRLVAGGRRASVAVLGDKPQSKELENLAEIHSLPRSHKMEVTSGTIHRGGITRVGSPKEVIRQLNEKEGRKKAEEASRELTPAAAHRQALKYAEAAIGRYLNVKA